MEPRDFRYPETAAEARRFKAYLIADAKLADLEGDTERETALQNQVTRMETLLWEMLGNDDSEEPQPTGPIFPARHLLP